MDFIKFAFNTLVLNKRAVDNMFVADRSGRIVDNSFVDNSIDSSFDSPVDNSMDNWIDKMAGKSVEIVAVVAIECMYFVGEMAIPVHIEPVILAVY